MTKQNKNNAIMLALMEITQIVKEVKNLNKQETKALQTKLLRWLMSVDQGDLK